MSKSVNKYARYARRKHRVNTIIKMSSSLPRLVVNRSNMHISVQLIDRGGNVLAQASDHRTGTGTKGEKAFTVGKNIAKLAQDAGVQNVVFDRNGFLYHGRVKQLAEGARSGGLHF